MNENAKTLTFVAVAAIVVVVAVITRPSLTTSSPTEDHRNQPLYPDFKDPLAVTSLEIVEFDDQRGEVHPLKVMQVEVKGKPRWSIPSHEDYPADAKDQVASAAAGLMGLTILEMVSDNQGDQREYGVVDPDPKTLKIGDTGVGERVVMKGKDGKDLLTLIIGKEVPGRSGLRYVRKVGQDPIFVVSAKTDRLSTKFEDWIERNLLGINTFDLRRLFIRDHSVDQINAALIQRGEMAIEYNDTGEPKWKLAEDRKYTASKETPGKGEWVPVKMPANEELNTARLDELKTALDDLKIVDVARKPAGLSADLKAAADITSREEAIKSLARMGFFAAELTKGQVEIFSNEGEIRITLKDGVEYVLRFGGIAGAGSSKKDKKDSENGEKETKSTGVNRYLFVMADYNPNMIAKPKLDPVPEEKKADDKKPEDKKPEDKKPEDKKPEDKKAEDKKAEDKKATDAEREKVIKENKRKQDEYDQKVADAKKRVTELNDRFADWYYVISDEVYRKIHLGHDELFKKKEPPKDQAKAASTEPTKDQAKEPTTEQSKEPANDESQEPAKDQTKDQAKDEGKEAGTESTEEPADTKDARSPAEILEQMEREGPSHEE
jgi:hypothetical protein